MIHRAGNQLRGSAFNFSLNHYLLNYNLFAGNVAKGPLISLFDKLCQFTYLVLTL